MYKIKSKMLHEQVADQLREMIHTAELSPGRKISERAVCDAVGVSRTPVREALRMLHSEGLVELIPQRGAFVREPCIEEIEDLFTVMGVLEGMCARLTVHRMTPVALAKIEELHQQLEIHYESRNHASYLEVNHAYHLLIQELSGNKVLHQVVSSLRQKVLLYRHRQLYQPDRFSQSIAEHRALLEAFRKKAPEQAETCMRQHLYNQSKALVGLYRSRGEKAHRG